MSELSLGEERGSFSHFYCGSLRSCRVVADGTGSGVSVRETSTIGDARAPRGSRGSPE